MNEDQNVRLHVLIEGRVQGVGFRYFVLEKANNLGVTGWVRNTFQGQVEVMAEGSRATLDKLLMHIRQGPPSSLVTEALPKWENATGEFKRFDVKFNF